jgi:hypothetical protein
MDFCHRINWRNDVMEGMLGREHNPHPSELLEDQQGAQEWMKNPSP